MVIVVGKGLCRNSKFRILWKVIGVRRGMASRGGVLSTSYVWSGM